MQNRKNRQRDVKQQNDSSGIKAVLRKHIQLVVGLVCVGIWYSVVLGVAGWIGWLLHLAAAAPWVSPWMLKVGHFVEGALYVGDNIAVLVGVGRELWQHIFHNDKLDK